MFAKVKNKKRALVYILLAVALIASGVTYAWFTASTTPANEEVDLGDLEVEGNLVLDTGNFLYEPGLDISVDGTVENTGTLPFIARLNLGANSTLVRDTNGVPLAVGVPPRTIDPDPNVIIETDEDELYSKITPQGAIIWTKDANGQYYLIMDPGMKVDVSFLAILDGDKMGNEYMNATINFNSSLEATQVLPEAVQSMWGTGVDLDDLMANIFPIKSGSPGRTMSVAGDSTAYLAEYLEQLFNR